MQRTTDLVDFREPLEHRHQPAVLPLRKLEVDQIVVEVIGFGARSDGKKLVSRGVDEDGP